MGVWNWGEKEKTRANRTFYEESNGFSDKPKVKLFIMLVSAKWRQ